MGRNLPQMKNGSSSKLFSDEDAPDIDSPVSEIKKSFSEKHIEPIKISSRSLIDKIKSTSESSKKNDYSSQSGEEDFDLEKAEIKHIDKKNSSFSDLQKSGLRSVNSFDKLNSYESTRLTEGALRRGSYHV